MVEPKTVKLLDTPLSWQFPFLQRRRDSPQFMNNSGRQRVKVVHIITQLDLGGAQLNTLHTVNNLDRAQFDPYLLCGREGVLSRRRKNNEKISNDRRKEPQIYPIFIENLAREVNLWKDLKALYELWRFLCDKEPEIVHTHSSKAGILGRIAAWFARVPVIIHTYHGFGFHEDLPIFRKRLYIWVERICCKLAEEIIFVSEENRRYAEKNHLVKRGQGKLIRSGIPLSNYAVKPVDKAEKRSFLATDGIRKHPPMVVSVGNLKPQKNPEGFVEVARLCHQKKPDISFVFVGNGGIKAKLQSKIIRYGLSGVVHFLGWRDDVPEILAAADLFILTSRWEGLPRSLVEAMKSELPCVCYATDGVKDVLKDGQNGYLIPVDAEKLMAERILEILNDPKKTKMMGKAASESIGSDFDINQMVTQQQELYLSLVGTYLPSRQ